MKKTLLFPLFIVISFASNAQSIVANDKATEMLKEFYTVYNTVWSTEKYPRLKRKVDSLQEKYCTIWLRKQIKQLTHGYLDHDLLTNDEFTDVTHLKTLKIIQNQKKPNAYIVSYVDHTLSAENKPIDKTVVIYVTVAIENGIYKIANAYGHAISLK